MDKYIRYTVILLLLFFTLVSSANAEGFRCNTRLVMEGDTTYEVKKKCGPPSTEEDLGLVKIEGERVQLKRYFYELGNGRFLRILDFHNGILYSVTDGPRT